MTLTLNYLAGRFNLPLYDCELNKNGFNVQSIAPTAISNSQMFWDDSLLTNIGTTCDASSANNNNTGAGLNNSLNGTLSPTRAWSGNGNLLNTVPAPAVGSNETDGLPCNDFGNARLLNTWGWGLTSSSANTIVYKGCSDLKVIKSVSTASPHIGANVNFTIVASNLGISNEPNAIVTDVLPTGYTFVSATPSIGTYNNTTGIWTIGNFANGASATLTVVATVNVSGNYPNTACVSGTNTDPVSGNNCSTVIPTPINSPIQAVHDDGTSVIGASGGQSLANVLVNDTLNGSTATLATVNLTQSSTTNAGVT